MKTTLLLASFIFFGAFAAQTQITKLNSNKSLSSAFPLGNNKAIFISDADQSLWVTDATVAGTFQLSNDIKFEKGGAIFNSKLIFTGTTPATGAELFITDGTISGTQLLKDIWPGNAASVPDQDMAELNGELYFTAATAAEGRELWKTNGTAAGTVLIKDIVAGVTGSNTTDAYNLFSNGSYLLLNVSTTADGNELWKSNGTSAGTNLLKNINPGAASSDANFFYKYNNVVLFAAKQAGAGTELWKTDGTTSGTQMVKDINAGEPHAISALYLYPFNNKLFFVATTLGEGDEIWTTDGTTANTTLLKDINPGAGFSFVSMFSSANVGNKFIFSAYSAATGFELWQSDGTTAGTQLFKDIIPGVESSVPFIFPSFEYTNGSFLQPLYNGKFFFTATTIADGSELWVSDGTAAGTVRVKDINPGAEGSIENIAYQYTSTGLYFSANDGVNGSQLWKSNGTAGGTQLVANINPGDDAEISFNYFFLNNKLLFQATDGDNITQYDLYRLDADLSPLPTHLLDFTVTRQQQSALLNWTSINEINSKDFSVQRSVNGREFSTIGSVNATGNTSQKQSYSFTDISIPTGVEVIYYRLLMNDKDGKSQISKTISFRIGTTKDWSVTLNNNPVYNNINITLQGSISPIDISVKDVSGKTILRKNAVSANGQLSIESSGLAPGVYILVAENKIERKAVRFVKQ